MAVSASPSFSLSPSDHPRGGTVLGLLVIGTLALAGLWLAVTVLGWLVQFVLVVAEAIARRGGHTVKRHREAPRID